MRNVLHQVKVSPVSGNKQPTLSRPVKHSWAVSHVWTERWRGGEASGSELWAPFVSSGLTPMHRQHSHCSRLSANWPAACQPGRRCVTQIALVCAWSTFDSCAVGSSIQKAVFGWFAPSSPLCDGGNAISPDKSLGDKPPCKSSASD